jgi:uncharacterized membrane protein
MSTSCIPKVAMSTNALQFADVFYHAPQTKSLQLQNTGQVMAQFRFIPKNQVHFYLMYYIFGVLI